KPYVAISSSIAKSRLPGGSSSGTARRMRRTSDHGSARGGRSAWYLGARTASRTFRRIRPVRWRNRSKRSERPTPLHHCACRDFASLLFNKGIEIDRRDEPQGPATAGHEAQKALCHVTITDEGAGRDAPCDRRYSR